MKATKQYSPAVLFIVLYKVVLTFESVDEILLKSETIQMKAMIKQYFPVVLFAYIKVNSLIYICTVYCKSPIKPLREGGGGLAY